MTIAGMAGHLSELVRAMRRRFGSGVLIENVDLPSLGGSNRTIIFDLVDGGSRRRLVSRQSTYKGPYNPFLEDAEQFRLMQIVHRAGVPTPEPILLYEPEDGMGDGFVTGFVSGETMPRRIIDSACSATSRAALARDVGRVLARLHGVSDQLGFLANVADSLDPVDAQRQRYDSYGEPHPAVELGLRWLELNRPDRTGPVLLHGDFRNGNLMVRDGKVVAVLDWECSHLGHPAEDIGWLGCRPWRFKNNERPIGGFGRLDDFLDGYSEAGGSQVSIDEVRYWQVFGLVRWAIINIMQAHGHLHGGRSDPAFAACGRNASLIEYDLLMTLNGDFQ